MPSRKQGSGEAQSELRRTSLRRLSSIASIPSLFSRRRSNTNALNTGDTADSTVSSSSNISLSSSTIANAPEPLVRQAATAAVQHKENDMIAELPASFPPLHTQATEKRSSYIHLPDDPIGGMPRSRTFSNLPVPSKTNRKAPLAASKSHARLPSAVLPSSRLPSPVASTRKYSHSRLASVGTNAPPQVRNRIKRSDTEPLLPLNLSHASLPPRSTAFKENITLSPVKPLAPLDIPGYDGCCDSTIVSSYASDLGWQPHNPFHRPTISGTQPSSLPYAEHPALRIVREHKSSPIYRSTKERAPTPGGSKAMDLPRWNSQPVLKNTTNVANQVTQPREIKQTRLLSARQAPTPQPPKTPLTTQPSLRRRLKSINNSGHIRQTSEQTPTQARSSTAKKPASRTVPTITGPEPPAFWLGRLSSLADRYRHEEMLSHLSQPKPPAKSETDQMHTPEASSARLRRALEHLHETCATSEARESFETFQLQYASVTGCPELARPIVLNKFEDGEEGGLGLSEMRKASFVERLLGRQKRRSLVLV